MKNTNIAEVTSLKSHILLKFGRQPEKVIACISPDCMLCMSLQKRSAWAQGRLGCVCKNLNNKVCHPVPTTVVHIYSNRNHVDLSLQGSGHLRMCSSQTAWTIDSNFTVSWRSFTILSGTACEVFLQQMWYVCCWGACMSSRYCTFTSTYTVVRGTKL